MVLFPRKKRYSKISYEKRLQLIKLVEEQEFLICRAAKRLRIKLPTAKVILTNYRKHGRIFQKKEEEADSQGEQQRQVPQENQENQVNMPPTVPFQPIPYNWLYGYYPYQNPFYYAD